MDGPTSRPASQSPGAPRRLDFDEAGLPWLDAPMHAVQRYVDSLVPQPEDPELLRMQLLHWMAFGFVIIPGAIEHQLIDALLQDLDELFADHTRYNTLIDCDLLHGRPIHEVPADVMARHREGKANVHLRVLEFHSNSIAAKKISLHPRITGFLDHVFRDRLIVLQSLMFFTGSEQEIHQDFAFVPAKIPSQLVASWVALEDIDPDAGPLAYAPGSHTIRKFDWGDGMFRTQGSSRDPGQFAEHIHATLDRAGLHETSFAPKKGDVFFWHAALAHGGTPVRNKDLTRKSYVTHYSAASVHDWHHLERQETAKRIEYPGGFFHQHPWDPQEEDIFRNGERL
jgi:hypothetical protein